MANDAATNAIDGNPATFWHTEWSQRTAPLPHTLVLDLGAQYQVDGFRYLPRQDGNPNGTIAGYQFYVSTDGTTWGTAVAAGTLAADTTEKTVRFTAKTGRYVRLVALSEMNGKPWTSAAELNVFGTAVASTPTSSLIPQQQLRVVSVDSQELVGENDAATNALDGNPATIWHTEWSQRTAPLPHTLVLDLGARYQVDGFRYLPRQDGNPNGTIAGYQFYVSADGTTWGTAVAAGTLAANTTEKTVRFTAKTGRYVRLVALSEINGKPWTSAAELNVFGAAAPSSTTTTSSLLAQSVTTSPVTSSTSTSTTTVVHHPQASPRWRRRRLHRHHDHESVQHPNGLGHGVVADVLVIYTHHDREPEHPLGNDADQYENVCQPLYRRHCDRGIHQSWRAIPARLWLLGWGRDLQTAPGLPRARHLALQNHGD